MSHRVGPLCGNASCPCARPGMPCEQFLDDGPELNTHWCARCGWEEEDHPQAEMNAPTTKETP